MLPVFLLLLPVALSACCGSSAFIVHPRGARANHGVVVAAGKPTDGGRVAGHGVTTSQKKQLVVVVVVVVVGDQTTRLYHGCTWAPCSLTLEHPTDARHFDVSNKPNPLATSDVQRSPQIDIHPHSATEAGAAPSTRWGSQGTSRRPNPRRAAPRTRTSARSFATWSARWPLPTRFWSWATARCGVVRVSSLRDAYI